MNILRQFPPTTITQLDRARRRLAYQLLAKRGAAIFPTPVVHLGVHKSLTGFFINLFRQLAQQHRFYFEHYYSDTKRFLHDRPRFTRNAVLALNNNFSVLSTLSADTKISVMVRDPRDLVISGLHYHQKTNETWCIHPHYNWHQIAAAPSYEKFFSRNELSRWHGRSYQDVIRELPGEQKTALEMLRMTEMLQQAQLNESVDQQIHRLRYEEFVGQEEPAVRALMEFYGCPDQVIDQAGRIASQLSLANQKGSNPHIRSGGSQQWKTEFPPELLKHFQAEWGEVIRSWGYTVD